MAKAIKIPPTEGQCSKIFAYGIQQTSSGRDSKSNIWRVSSFGVMRCFHLHHISREEKPSDGAHYIVPYIAPSCATECLNGKYFALFHLRLVVAFHDWYTFTPMNTILNNVVTVKISDTLDW